MGSIFVWCIAASAIAAILIRPREWPEAVWACSAAILLVTTGLLSPQAAGKAIGKGTDVYLFLAGMMLLAELARREGVFDWLAGHAVRAARGSRARLFVLVYAVGVVVTVFLSNDATAVVLTPAVYAAVKKARAEILPYLFSCAFIANAASFVLPISNPANLVLYGKQIPPLIPWMKLYLAPSVLSIATTFVVLRLLSNRELKGNVPDDVGSPGLSAEGRRAVWGLAVAAIALMSASAAGAGLGMPTFLAAAIAILITTRAKRKAIADVVGAVSWSVLPLVAGLFVLVEALDGAGALGRLEAVLRQFTTFSRFGGTQAAAFSVAALSNVMNNLPSGLLAGSALQATYAPEYLRRAIVIGTDLGPNLSITGSLATILWLIALRREGVRMDGWMFLKIGAVAMPAALFLATLAIVVPGL